MSSAFPELTGKPLSAYRINCVLLSAADRGMRMALNLPFLRKVISSFSCPSSTFSILRVITTGSGATGSITDSPYASAVFWMPSC